MHCADTQPGGLLFVVAAPLEARAVAKAFDAAPGPVWQATEIARVGDRPVLLLETGVGKACAAAATAAALATGIRPVVVNTGVCGSLPVDVSVPIGQSVLADACVNADEGSATPAGFLSIARMGFPPPGLGGDQIPVDAELVRALAPVCNRVGTVATVSTCSGTDALAREVVRRTGAIAEAMEGAAVGVAAHRFGLRFAEARVVSNTTGDRESQRWDLDGALGNLERLAARVAGAVLGPADAQV